MGNFCNLSISTHISAARGVFEFIGNDVNETFIDNKVVYPILMSIRKSGKKNVTEIKYIDFIISVYETLREINVYQPRVECNKAIEATEKDIAAKEQELESKKKLLEENKENAQLIEDVKKLEENLENDRKHLESLKSDKEKYNKQSDLLGNVLAKLRQRQEKYAKENTVDSGLEDLEPKENENTTDEENRQERKIADSLDDALKIIFTTTPGPKGLQKKLFRASTFDMIIVNRESGLIIRNSEDLNEAIIQQKNSFYKKIYRYLKSKNMDLDIPDTMFDEQGRLTNGYLKALALFEEEMAVTNPNKYKQGILQLDDTEVADFQNRIRRGYSDYLSKNTDTDDYTFLDTINAYISLKYFDNLIKDTLGKVIYVDDIAGENVDVNKIFQKYQFSDRFNDLAKGWNTGEHVDGIKEAGRFSKFIIENIKFIDYKTKKEQTFGLNSTLFTAAVTNLFSAAIKSQSFGIESGGDQLIEFIRNFHRNPREKFREILHALFAAYDKESGLSGLKATLRRNGLSEYDLNTLYSIYDFLYVSNDKKKSLTKIEYDTFYASGRNESFTQGDYPISECILGFVDRLMQANYLETRINSEGEMIVRVKKKFSSRKAEMDMRSSLNKLASRRTINDVDNIQQKYQYMYNKDSGAFEFKLNGVTYIIKPRSERNNVFEANHNATLLQKVIYDKSGKASYLSANNDSLILTPKKIDILLTTNIDSTLRDVLTLIGDTFGFDTFSRDFLNKLLVAQNLDSGIIYKMFKSAARAGSINFLYSNFYNSETDQSFYEFASEFIPDITITESKQKNNIWDKTIDEMNPELKAVRFYDNWVDTFTYAEAIVEGTNTKSTTKDMFGNNIGNFSTSFFGGNIMYYLNQASKVYDPLSRSEELRENSVQSKLLFSNMPQLISGVVINLDTTTKDGRKKVVKKMNTGELLQQAIFNNFYGAFYGSELSGSYVIQPTTYSDKTKIVEYIINAKKALGTYVPGNIKKALHQLSNDELINIFVQTIGKSYTQSFRNTISKYIKIFNISLSDFSDLELVNKFNEFNNNKEEKITEQEYIQTFIDNESLLEVVLDKLDWLNSNIEISNKEEWLNSRAQQEGIEMFLDSDYRAQKNGTILFNELLDYYANYLFTDKKVLAKRMREECIKFANDIIDSNLIFYLQYSDGTETAIQEAINNLFRNGKYDPDKNESDKDNAMLAGLDLKVGDNIQKKFMEKWVRGQGKGRKLVIARSGNKIYTFGDKIPLDDPNVEINPILEKYFYTDSLLANNLRLSLTGSELAHPLKRNKPIDLNQKEKVYATDEYGEYEFNANTRFINRTQFFEQRKKQYEEIESELQMTQLKRNVIIPATLQYMTQNTLRGVPKYMNIAVIRDLKAPVFNYNGDSGAIDGNDGSGRCNSLISIIENYSLQDQKVGAVKKTIMHAPIYSTGGVFLGKWAIFALENEGMRSGQGNYSDDYKLNKAMLNQMWYTKSGDLNSDYINKDRMMSIDDEGNRRLQKIDLTSVRGTGRMRKLDFSRDILKGRDLYREAIFYGTGKKIYRKIIGLNKEDVPGSSIGVYYTTECTSTEEGRLGAPEKYYHLFDEDSNHIELSEALFKRVQDKLQTVIEETGETTGVYYTVTDDISIGGRTILQKGQVIHTINSNYELVESLGGINSVELNEKNKFVPSESSNYAAVEFINALSYINPNDIRNKTEMFDTDMYYQPLKDCMIHYAVNNSAVKNGAGNINQKEAWNNPDKLKHITIGYDGIGIQQDSDHEVDESLLTEFSQVIASLDALGNVHDLARNVFENLSQIAISSAVTETEALEKFLTLFDQNDPDEKLIHDVYDTIGRIIILNFKNDKGEGNLSDEILAAVKEQFNKNINHLNDEWKIPFSDPGVFSSILPTFVSAINNKAIKRKYPGSGSVQCPSYGTRQVYDIEGIQYQFKDILEELYDKGRLEKLVRDEMKSKSEIHRYLKDFNESDIQWKKKIVKSYLEDKQNELIDKSRKEGNTSRDQFHPTDNALVIIKSVDGTMEYEFRISLDDPNDYFIFTQNYWYDLLKDSEGKELTSEQLSGLNLSTAEFFKDITRPRNLAPAKTTWEEETDVETTVMIDGVPTTQVKKVWRRNNIFSEDVVQKGFTSIVTYRNDLGIAKSLVIPIKWEKSSDLANKIQKITGEKVIEIINVERRKSKNSEIQSFFRNLKEGYVERTDASGRVVRYNIRNLEDIPSEVIMSSLYRRKFAQHTNLSSVLKDLSSIQIKPREEITGFDKYHITLGRHTGRHSFITFNDVKQDDNTKIIEWDKYKPVKKKIKINGKKEERILIYSIDKNSVLQYPIGFCELMKGYKRDEYGTIRDENNEEVSSESGIYINDANGDIYKVNIFVNKYKVKHTTPTKYGDKPTEHILYKLDVESIKKLYGTEDDSNPEYMKMIQDILSYVYEMESSEEIRVNLDSNFWSNSKIKRDQLAYIIKNTKFQDPSTNKSKDYLWKLLVDQKQNGRPVENTYGLRKDDFKKIAALEEQLKNISFEQILEARGDEAKMDAIIYQIRSNLKLEERDKYIPDFDLIKKVLFDKNRTENTIDKYKKYIIDKYTDTLRKKNMWAYTSNHYKDRNKAVQSSFLRSLYVICSRIPAQSLQSFMQSKVVGFLEGNNNYVYVSHWQLYLQGSDYDIDKSYIMGSEIDRNGIYVGWSPLFDYTSIRTLKESEKIPYPEKDRYISLESKKNQFDITDYVIKYIRENQGEGLSEQNRINLLRLYIDLLTRISKFDIRGVAVDTQRLVEEFDFANDLIKSLTSQPELTEEYLIQVFSYEKIAKPFGFLDEDNEVNKDKVLKHVKKYLNASKEKKQELIQEDAAVLTKYRTNFYIRDLLKKINDHNKYTPSTERFQAATRNSISSKIGLIVEDLENRTHSYTPITMDNIRPDESNIKPISLLNPATKFVMQVQNMVGKDVIGISAVGMKIFYNLTYYFNEEIRNSRLTYLTFNKEFERIQNRYNESKNETLQSLIKDERDAQKEEIIQLVRGYLTDTDLKRRSYYYNELEEDITRLEEALKEKVAEQQKNVTEEPVKATSGEEPELNAFGKPTLKYKINQLYSKEGLTEENKKLLEKAEKLLEEYEKVKAKYKEKEDKRKKEYKDKKQKIYDQENKKYEEYLTAKKKWEENGKVGTKPAKVNKPKLQKAVPKDDYYEEDLRNDAQKLYREVTSILQVVEGKKRNKETKKLPLADRIAELERTENLTLYNEEELEFLENIKSQYSYLLDIVAIWKAKNLKTNVENLLDKYVKSLSGEERKSAEELIKEGAVDTLISSINPDTKLKRELYIAYQTGQIINRHEALIAQLRKEHVGIKRQVKDHLANVNFAIPDVVKLKESFSNVKNIYDRIKKENPDIDILTLSNRIVKELQVQQDDADKADLFISELLSAATDNAKELILAQINAGSDLAGYYLYLLSLGFNIKDIVAFMTSPVIQTLHDLTQTNMFSDHIKELTINDIINILTGNLESVLSESEISRLRGLIGVKEESFLNYIEERIDGTINKKLSDQISGPGGDFMETVVQTIKRNLKGQVFSEYIKDLKELKRLNPLVQEHSNLGNVFLALNQGLPTSEEDLLKKLGAIDRVVKQREKVFGINKYFIKGINKELSDSKLTVNQVKKMIKDEKKSREEDIESEILGETRDILYYDDLNETEEQKNIRTAVQMIKNTETFKNMVEKLFQNNPTLNKNNIADILIKAMLTTYSNGESIVNGFNVREWITDYKYQQRVKDYYNLIKGTWNVFDVVSKLPQYRSIFRLFKVTYAANHHLSLKARLIDTIHQRLLDDGKYLTEHTRNKIQEYVDDKLIDKFLVEKKRDLKIPIPVGFKFLNSEDLEDTNTVLSYITLGHNDGLANFKKLMEEYIIPKLKSGELVEISVDEGGNLKSTESIYDISSENNYFIKNLTWIINGENIGVFKLGGVDLMNIEASDNSLLNYQEALDSFIQLRKYKYAGLPLTDWFMLYNLVVNKNKYGSDRLTGLFRSFIKSLKEDNIYKEYYSYIGQNDYRIRSFEQLQSFGIDLSDLQLYLAEIVPEQYESIHNEPYIAQYKNGQLIYKYRVKYGEYRELSLGVSKALGSTINEKNRREAQKNRKQYRLRVNPSQENKRYFKDLLTSRSELDILKGLVMLELNSIARINIKC